MFILPLIITNSLMGYGTYGFSYFNVSSATANWTEANGTCFLALPSVTFDGKYTLIDDVIGDAMTNDSWLGYFRYGYILSYYGCWSMADVTSNTMTLTVADCMEYCLNRDSKSVIAVRNSSCYCISAILGYNKDTTCDQQCPKESFTCGSTDSSGASVYVRNQDQSFADDDQDNHECLAVIGGHHKWRPCSELHPLQCSKGYTVEDTGDWMTYQDRCPPPSGGNNSWTNIVRSWSTFINNHTETKRIPLRRRVEFGYLVHRNNRTYMEFAPASMEKQYICQSNADMVTSLGSSYFNVSSTTANWAKANDTCFLALPPLKFDGEGALVDDVFGDVMVNDSWLGYFRYGFILEYIGCWNMTGVAINSATMTLGGCVDYCYNRDIRSVIAVRDTSCYCIPSLKRYRKETSCDQRCPKESFTCGSTDPIGASVYMRKHYQAFPDDVPNNYECMAVIGGLRKWRPCSELHPVTCFPWYEISEIGDWKTYQDRCPRSSGDGYSSWTNTVRSWSTVIHNHTDSATVPGNTWIEFGYLVHRNNRMYLEFAPDSMEKQYICQFNADDKITTPSNYEKWLNEGGIKVLTAIIWLLAGLCVALIVSVTINCVFMKQKMRKPTTPPSQQSRYGHAATVSEPVAAPANNVTPTYQDYLHPIPATNIYETVA